jgi:hypothetical protein
MSTRNMKKTMRSYNNIRFFESEMGQYTFHTDAVRQDISDQTEPVEVRVPS